MSWDIFVQDLPDEARTVDDIPPGFRPRSLGARSELIARIQDAVPSADFSDPSWGLIESSAFSIEVNLGDDEEVPGFAFHVRGGDAAAVVVADILARLGLRALDLGNAENGGFFDPQAAVESLRRWHVYRDHVVGSGGEAAPAARCAAGST